MTTFSDELITLARDCKATLIPFGNAFTLKEGDEVRITQALGGSYTVMARGSLFRIEGKDADAIGKEVIEKQEDNKEITGTASETAIWDVLKTCYDPEIPINMVDLGLIYSCDLIHLDGGGTDIDIKMTLTAPGCGMGPMMVDEVRAKVMGVSNVRGVEIELVWDPPWSQHMISEAARLELGMY
jgi:probable FeS assembly SUF system protein SufT